MVLDRLLEPDESSGSIRRVEHSDMCRSITRETGIDKSGENNISVSVQVKGPWAASLVGGSGWEELLPGKGAMERVAGKIREARGEEVRRQSRDGQSVQRA